MVFLVVLPQKEKLKNSQIGSLNNLDFSLEEYISILASLPLAYEPGTHWEYGRSVEVLGRVIEKSSKFKIR